MIRKFSLALATLLMLGLSTAFTPKSAEAGRIRRFIRVRYRGRLPYIRLYINGTYKGKVRRGSSKSIYLKTRRRYRIRAKYAGRTSFKSVYLTPGSSTRIVTFYRPTRGGGRIDDGGDRPIRRRRVSLRIRYRGRKPYARCYINGISKGKIRRRSSRTFLVRRGRRYRIEMRFAGRRRKQERLHLQHTQNHPRGYLLRTVIRTVDKKKRPSRAVFFLPASTPSRNHSTTNTEKRLQATFEQEGSATGPKPGMTNL